MDSNTDANSLAAARNKRKGRSEAIAALLQELPQGTHVTAPEVLSLAQKAGIQISLSSVYRTLGSLKSQGLITALSGEHGVRYESLDHDHDHDHLICMICGLTVEFSDDLLNGFGQDLARRNGYDYKRSKFDIYGLCEQCRSKSDEYRFHQASNSLLGLEEKLELARELLIRTQSNLDGRKLDRSIDNASQLLEIIDAIRLDAMACQRQLESKAGNNEAPLT